jgi:hypothetical protein
MNSARRAYSSNNSKERQNTQVITYCYPTTCVILIENDHPEAVSGKTVKVTGMYVDRSKLDE